MVDFSHGEGDRLIVHGIDANVGCPFSGCLLYGTDKGRLIYDENGAATGGRTLVAVLRGAPNLSVAF